MKEQNMPQTPEFDPQVFRRTLGHYASGITIVTGIVDDEPAGFTCQSFYSVSVEPPLVSFSVMKTSTTYPRIRETGSFAINVLSQAQHQVSSQFARSGTDKWAGISWAATASGNPAIDDCLMWLDCELWAEHEAGDHQIVIGRVREMGRLGEENTAEPLLFYKGRYRYLSALDQVAS
jgi:3-hydroxy-9,10-secoandrosta-1,3,5(10)-triene-9,17-dione monooxygenase reductase component